MDGCATSPLLRISPRRSGWPDFVVNEVQAAYLALVVHVRAGLVALRSLETEQSPTSQGGYKPNQTERNPLELSSERRVD